MRPDSEGYWDAIAGQWREERPQRLWRTFCDTLNGDLIRRLLDGHQGRTALKTDLFDEATGETGLVPCLFESAESVVGFDLSFVTTHLARTRHAELRPCTTDARSLPFADASFDIVLSNSTLDHFDDFADIEVAIAEISRVLKPGGRLLLTLDNLVNPVIALRSVLPHDLLRQLGLVPYFTGATCGPRRLRRLLTQLDLKPLHCGAMMHCPRVPAVMTANFIDSLGKPKLEKGLMKFLRSWEILEKIPTRYLSGYFITVLAERSSG